ncbi:hypothetical protein, partial [Pseudarthrobacter sp. NPDC080039]|uniref:hypothetical protein n=1 Tax=Pseudarthrobacter sp. NPDC080039 TaxID=3155290 RepID=UPI00344F4C11
MSWFRRIAPLFTLALFTATAGVTAAVADSPAPHEHYANHPIRVRPGATAAPTGLAPATVQGIYNFPTGT